MDARCNAETNQNTIGRATFPGAKKLYINCDAGGSDGWRVHLWKYELAFLAEETGLEIHVSHFPPGTSKWNKIEHRLFCYISRNRAGKPLIDIQTVVNLIGSTTTKNGLKVRRVVDRNQYPTGACSQKAWNERIVIFANLSKNQLEICLKLTFQSLIVWNFKFFAL